MTYTTVEHWLGRPLAEPDPASVVRRYLAAFGPAAVADVQKWSGLTGLRRVVSGMELTTCRDERGRTLYDLPDAPPPPDPDTPVSASFTADFDNLLLSHADLPQTPSGGTPARIADAEHFRSVMSVNGIVRGTVLLDGFVGGTWTFERRRGAAAVCVAPYGGRLARADREVLTARALRLLAVTDPGAEHDVRFG